MKNIILIIMLLSSIPLCSQENQTPDIIGSWTWIETSGGFAGRIENPQTTGNEIMIVFTAEKYTKYVNGELIDEFTYKIEIGNTIRKSEDCYLIIYETEKKQSIELIDDRLILFDECYDCFVFEYKRK